MTTSLFAVLLALTFVSLASAQTSNISTSNLPKRELTITGAQISTDAYIDGGLLARRIFPLDENGLLDSPEIALLCYSPWLSPKNWSMFAHMPIVDAPIAFYYPLTYTLGDWKYEYGDTAICELWECDGAPGGCDPNNPAALPSLDAGDDLLGRASLNLGSFAILGTVFLNMTVPPEGRGKVGTNAGIVRLGCPGCRDLLWDNPSWVNPYSAPTPTISPITSPSPSPPLAASPPPPAPATSTTPPPPPPPLIIPPVDSYDGPPQTEEVVIVPPVEPSPPPPASSPASPPAPPPPPPVESPVDQKPEHNLPPDDSMQQDKSAKLLPEPQPVTTAKKTTKTTLIIVLSVLGAIIGILLLTVLGCVVVKRGWKPVHPAVPPPPPPAQKTKRKPSNRHLRIRVQRPADAESAMRQHRVDGAIAELPWAPKTNV